MYELYAEVVSIPDGHTATISESPASWEDIAWDVALTGDTSEEDAVLHVTGDATIALSSVELNKLTLDVSEGVTLTLTGTITVNDQLHITGDGAVDLSGLTITGTVGGDGTVIYNGNGGTTLPQTGIGWTDGNTWTGTFVVENYAATGWTFNNYGNINSTLSLSDVNCYLNGNASVTLNPALELVGEGLKITNGNQYNVLVVRELTGDGNLSVSGGASAGDGLVIQNAEAYTGAVSLSTGNYVIKFGDSGSYATSTTGGMIIVDSGESVTIASGTTWSTNNKNGVQVDGTLTLAASDSVLSLTDDNAAIKGSGTIIYGGSENVPDIASLTQSGWTGTIQVSGAATPMTVQSSASTQFMNSGSQFTLASGYLYLTSAAGLTGKVNINSGAVLGVMDSTTTSLAFELGNVAGNLSLLECTALTSLDIGIGTMRSLSSLTLPSSATLATVNIAFDEVKGEGGTITLTNVSGIPVVEGRTYNVTVNCLDGRTVTGTYDSSTSTISYVPSISGAATDLDWDFTDGVNDDFEQAPSGMGKSQDSTLTFYTDANDSTKTGVYIKHHPYTTSAASWFTENSAAMTVVVVGTMPSTQNTIFLNFGSAYGNKYGLLIATTANENEVLIGYNYGGTVTPITTMTVPNASSSRHSYIVTKVDGATATTFTVYLDGTKWKTVTTDAATLGTASDVKVAFTGNEDNGIQVGSDYGGNIRNAAVYSAASDDVGILNVLRAYGRIITQAEIDAYAAAFPYDSPSGKSTRTFSAASENWIDETENSAVWSNTKSGNTSGTPDVGAQLEVTASAASAQTIEVNLAAQASYESLLVEGSQTVTFELADGYTGAIAPGKTTIKTPVIVKPGVLNLSGGPTFVEGDGHLTFDYSGYTMTGTSAIELTGQMDQNDSAVAIVPPADQHYTYTYGYSGTQYVITPAVAVAVLNHNDTLTGYTTIDAAMAAADSGDTVTLQTAYLTPGTHATYAGDKTGVNVVVQGYTIAPAVADGTTTWSTSSYIWTGAGTDNNWTTPANWGLASGYPGSTVRNASNYYNTNDAVYFGADAEVSVDSDRYAASITLANSAKVTFTGGGSIKTGYNNNSGSIQLLGSGEVHMKGIKFVLPYNTKGNESATIEVPIVVEPCEAENNIYLATGSTGRNSKLTLATALQGSGNITFGAGTFSQTTLALTGDLSAFSGTATVSAKIAALPVGGTGTWVISSDDVANAITSISFTGGTLSLPAAVATDVSAKIAAGTHTASVKVATASNTEWSAGAINGSYGFVKSGAGTLTLTQVPTYTGATTVSEGILVVPVGTTFNGAVTVAEGAKIQFEADPTWADGATPTICTFTTEPDAATLGRIEITGFGGRQSAELNYNSGTGAYVATVTSPTLVWNGADGANWGDEGVWLVDGAAATFMSGDKVSFPDSLFTGDTTELTVNVDADVNPSLVTIAPGAGHTYKFTGTGKVTTEDIVVAATGAGTVKLAADVFSGCEIETAGMVAVEAGEGAVTLAKVTSSSDSTALKVTSGSLTLTEGLGCIIQNDSTLILDGTFNLNKTITGTSANAELIIRGTIDRTQNGMLQWLNGYPGKFKLENNATLKYYFRNSGSQYQNRNMFGNGAVEFAGGTIYQVHANSPQDAEPINDVTMVDNTTTTISRQDGTAVLRFKGTFDGNGTLDGDASMVLALTDASEFGGAVSWTHSSSSTANNIETATATSADATYNVSGAPAAATQLIGLNFSGTAEMGAFNVSSANAQIGVNNANVELEIGGKANSASTLNGQFITNPLTLTKVGANSTLTLGGSFSMPSGSTIDVDAGSLSTGALTYSGLNLAIGEDASYTATGDVVLDGTTLDVDGFATFGTASAPAWLKAQNNAVINLNAGGELDICRITAYGDYTVNFDGGTLTEYDGNGAGKENIIGGRNTDWEQEDNYTITLNVKAGGLTVDTATATTITPALAGDAQSTGGGLTKKGVGTLTLAAAPTFTGAITVAENGGTIVLPAGNYNLGPNTIVSARDTANGTMTLAYATTVALTVPAVNGTTVTVTYVDSNGDTQTVAVSDTANVYLVPVGTEVTVTYTGTTGTVVTSGGTISGTYNEAATIDTASVVTATVAVWEGDVDKGWTTPGNWSTGSVPDEHTPVQFPNTGSAYTVWIGTDSKCGTMQIDGDVTFAQWDDNFNWNQEVSLYGNVTGRGTLTLRRTGIDNKTGATITFSPNLVIAETKNGDAYADSWISGWNGTASAAIVINGEVTVNGKLVLWHTKHTFNNNVTFADGAFMGDFQWNGITFNGSIISCDGTAYLWASTPGIDGTGVTFDGSFKVNYNPQTEIGGYFSDCFGTAGTYTSAPISTTMLTLKSDATIILSNDSVITTPMADASYLAVVGPTVVDGVKTYTCVIPAENAPAIDMTAASPVTVTTSGTGGVTFAVSESSLKPGLYYRVKAVDGKGKVSETASTEKVKYTGDNASALNFTAPLPTDGVLYYTIEASDYE